MSRLWHYEKCIKRSLSDTALKAIFLHAGPLGVDYGCVDYFAAVDRRPIWDIPRDSIVEQSRFTVEPMDSGGSLATMPGPHPIFAANGRNLRATKTRSIFV